jgi:hypothetical protein
MIQHGTDIVQGDVVVQRLQSKILSTVLFCMTSTDLVSILTTYKIVNTAVKFIASAVSYGSVAYSRNVVRSDEDYYDATVSVEFMVNGRPVVGKFRTKFSDRTLIKRALKVIDPSLNLNATRSKGVKVAIRSFLDDIRYVGANGVRLKDKSKLIEQIQRVRNNRDVQDRKIRNEISIKLIKDGIMKSPDGITMQELEDIWKECQVRSVMEDE